MSGYQIDRIRAFFESLRGPASIPVGELFTRQIYTMSRAELRELAEASEELAQRLRNEMGLRR